MLRLIVRGMGHIIFNMTEFLRQGGHTRKQAFWRVIFTILRDRLDASISVSSARGPVRERSFNRSDLRISTSTVPRTF
jgi:hypothetical protein